MADDIHFHEDTAQVKVDVDPKPFEIVLWFRNGLQKSYVVTAFVPIVVDGQLRCATWSQDQAVPGDELLQWFDAAEILMVSTASIEDGR